MGKGVNTGNENVADWINTGKYPDSVEYVIEGHKVDLLLTMPQSNFDPDDRSTNYISAR